MSREIANGSAKSATTPITKTSTNLSNFFKVVAPQFIA